MTLRTLNYGKYGIFLIMGHAGFCPSAVVIVIVIVILMAPRVLMKSHRIKRESQGCAFRAQRTADAGDRRFT